MSDQNNNQELIARLLLDRDAEYRRANMAEQQLAELSDMSNIKQELEQKIASQEKEIQQKDKTVEKLEDKISQLEQKLKYLERKVWGAMSERRKLPEDPAQLKLDFEGLDMSDGEQELVKEAIDEIQDYQRVHVREHEKKVPIRQKLPESLPQVEEHIYPEGYKGNEDDWILFEETETSEHLELKPAEFYVRVTIRHKGIRKDTKAIVTAPTQNEPLAKSYATASLLTDLMVGKYVDHLPFHRQIQMYKRLGVTLPASTIEQWFHDVADLMRPTYLRLKDIILSKDYIQSDETTIPIVDNEKQKAVKGYLWLVKDIETNQVFFHYNEGSRGQKVVIQLFKDYKGAIQTDGYAGYNILEKFEGITTLNCWCHTRRYFDRALSNDKARAEYALAQIGMLYDVEHMADDQNMDNEQRRQLRVRLAYPIIKAFEKWCEAEYPKVLPKSPIGKALAYVLTYINGLARYILDGKYRPDTNLIENSVRPVAVGRRNYLFCGNHDAAEDAAVIYSLMGCCKAVDVDFKTWMNYFLTHVHEYDNDYSKNLEELLPLSLKNAGKF